MNIFLIGTGGQGVLTLCDMISKAAARQSLPALYYPVKGMAQRGGSVMAHLRLGRKTAGPKIPPGRADLVIAMERSEALRGLPFLKPGGDLLLYGHVLPPTDRLSGKAAYPSLE